MSTVVSLMRKNPLFVQCKVELESTAAARDHSRVVADAEEGQGPGGAVWHGGKRHALASARRPLTHTLDGAPADAGTLSNIELHRRARPGTYSGHTSRDPPRTRTVRIHR